MARTLGHPLGLGLVVGGNIQWFLRLGRKVFRPSRTSQLSPHGTNLARSRSTTWYIPPKRRKRKQTHGWLLFDHRLVCPRRLPPTPSTANVRESRMAKTTLTVWATNISSETHFLGRQTAARRGQGRSGTLGWKGREGARSESRAGGYDRI